MTTDLATTTDRDHATSLIKRAPQTPCGRLPSSVRSKVKRFSDALERHQPPSVALGAAGAGADDVDGLEDAISDLTRRLQETPEGETMPSRFEHIQSLLGWLSDRVTWPANLAANPAEAERKAVILAEDLAELPLECVAAAVRDYPKRNKFWPSATVDLFEPAELRRDEMRGLRARLRMMRDAAASPWAGGRDVGNIRYGDPGAAARSRRDQERGRDDRGEQRFADVLARLRAGLTSDDSSGDSEAT